LRCRLWCLCWSGVCGGVWWGETGACDALLVSESRSRWVRDGVVPTATVEAVSDLWGLSCGSVSRSAEIGSMYRVNGRLRRCSQHACACACLAISHVEPAEIDSYLPTYLLSWPMLHGQSTRSAPHQTRPTTHHPSWPRGVRERYWLSVEGVKLSTQGASQAPTNGGDCMQCSGACCNATAVDRGLLGVLCRRPWHADG
jgi:hypothetical protein